MTKRAFCFLGRVAVAVLCIAPWAVTQNVTLTSAGSNIYDNIYVSPYYATVNGAPNTPIVCDDFKDDSHLNTSWTGNIVAFSSLATPGGLAATAWGSVSNALQLYEEAAWLTEGVLKQAAGTQGQINYSFAVWAVFDPSGVASYLDNGGHPSAADIALCNAIFGSGGCGSSNVTGGLLGLAQGNSYTLSEFSNVSIITPLVNGTTCTAGSCPEQEFIEVPEGGAAVAYLFLAGLCCCGAMLLRSRRGTNPTVTA
jgi:hypothetical protein